MRLFILLLWCLSLNATRNHFSISRDEVANLRRCRSDSELVTRRRHSLRRVDNSDTASQQYNINYNIYNEDAPDTHNEDPEGPGWFRCTRAQAEIKAAYIGCFATIVAGLGGSLIGVLLSK